MRMRIAVVALAVLALGGQARGAAVVIYAGLVKASPVGLPRLWVSAKRARGLQAAAAEALRRT